LQLDHLFLLKMLISIIVPIYNVEKYLKKCLDSIVHQTYKKLQIILVNDGSPDNSASIAQEYVDKDSRFQLFHQENKGLSGARNTGLKYVAGDYVFYLDSDDILIENAIEILVKAAMEENADVVQGNFYYDYPEYLLLNKQQKEKKVIYNKKEALWVLLEHKTVLNFAWGKLIKSELAKQFLFPEAKFYEDGFWKYKLMHALDIYVSLNTPILYYLQRGSAISGSFSMRNLDQLESEVLRAAFVKKEYGEKFYNKALKLLNQKIIQHSNLLDQLSKEDALIYKNKIEEIQEQFALKEKFPKTYAKWSQKKNRLMDGLKNKIFGNNNWERIEK